MNGIRKLLHLATAAVLAASLAPAAYAATKQFTATAVNTGTTWKLTYINTSTGGGPNNSYINSVTFTAPVGVWQVALQPNLVTANTSITPACAKATTAAGACAAGTLITINNFNGIPPSGNNSGYVTMNAAGALSVQSCTSGANWSVSAFTGNASGGSYFNPQVLMVTGTVSCALNFVTQPASTQVATNITSVVNDPANTAAVQVQALIGGSVATSFNGTITLAPTPAAGIAGAIVTASSGVANFGSSANPPQTALTLDTPGTYTLTASATGFTSATSNAFKIFAGVLNCSDPFPLNIIDPQHVAPDQPGYAYGNRNGWNKDGVTDGACIPVLYTFTNNIRVSADPLLSNTVNLTWDTQSQVNAAFQYTVNWQAVPVDSALTGWSTAPRPQTAWLDTDGNLTTGSTPSAKIAWMPALACVNDTLPMPYGTLAANLDTTVDANNTSSITINGVAPVTYPAGGPSYDVPAAGTPNIPPVPFPIVIADTVNGAQSTMTERMTAIALTTTVQNGDGSWNLTYTVRRGTNTEGGSTKASHTAGYSVMSTPLPIIPNDSTTFKAPYKVNTQAQMCIAKHGFTSFQIDANGNTQVIYTTTIFDIGDGWSGIR